MSIVIFFDVYDLLTWPWKSSEKNNKSKKGKGPTELHLPPMDMEFVQEKVIEFENGWGKRIRHKAIYQDTMPGGREMPTVVGFHGAIGTHTVYKPLRKELMLRGIRFIGVNFPGSSKLMPGDPDEMRFNNAERSAFINALLDSLNIQGKLIIAGRCRGAENALITAVQRKTYGLCLLVGWGRQSIYPWWARAISYSISVMHSYLRLLRPLIDHVATKLMVIFTLFPETPNTAGTIVRIANAAEYEELEQIRHNFPQNGIRLLYYYTGRDRYTSKRQHLVTLPLYKCETHIDVPDKSQANEKIAIMKVREAFNSGNLRVSLYLSQDRHFITQERPRLIAENIAAMLKLECGDKLIPSLPDSARGLLRSSSHVNLGKSAIDDDPTSSRRKLLNSHESCNNSNAVNKIICIRIPEYVSNLISQCNATSEQLLNLSTGSKNTGSSSTATTPSTTTSQLEPLPKKQKLEDIELGVEAKEGMKFDEEPGEKGEKKKSKEGKH